MLSFIMPLFVSIFGTSMLSIIFKKRFEIMLPIYFMFSALFVYVLTVFNLFDVAIYLLLLFSCICLIYLIYCRVKKRKQLNDIIKYIFTPGLIIYFMIYIFVFILNYNRGFNTWDEFSHWGMMIKETIRLKSFYTSPLSILRVHQDYPPIITIHESVWCILAGGYKESLAYISLQILGLSLLFPFLSRINLKKKYEFILEIMVIFLSIIMIPILITAGEAYFYTTIYNDAILGLLIGYGLGLVFINEKYDKFFIFNLVILFSFIILTKQIAIVFIMLIIGNIVLNMFVSNKFKRINYNKKFVLSIFILIIIPLLLSVTWNLIVNVNNIVGQFNMSDIKLIKLFGIYNGTVGELYQTQVMHNFVNSILYSSKFVVTNFSEFTYVQVLLVACVLIYFIKKFLNRDIDNKKYLTLIITIIVGAVGYAFTLMVLYVFCFDEYEALNLASLYRYINTYWLAIFSMIGMIFMYVVCFSKKGNIEVYLLLLVYILIFWLPVSNFKMFIPSLTYNSVGTVVQGDVDIIKSHVKDNDRIYVITQNGNGFITFLMQYAIHPNKINVEYYSLGDKYNENDVWTKNITEEEWLKQLNDYDYLYLYNIDDKFMSKYGTCFINDNVHNKQLYKIDKLNKKFILIE